MPTPSRVPSTSTLRWLALTNDRRLVPCWNERGEGDVQQ
jgi:hypothetical protein